MLSSKRDLVVVALSLLIGHAQSLGNPNSMVAPKGLKVLTVAVIGGDQTNS
jgi:hypothetical protein